MLRSLMESIAFEIRFNIESIRSSGISLKKVILSGGASKNRLLCQIICDVLQSEVVVFVEAEASSRGVFLLARNSLLAGTEREASNLDGPENMLFNPDPDKKATYDSVYEKYIRLGDHLEKLKQ